MPIGRNSFIQMTKLSNVKGRITYISSHAKQENLYAVYETTERKFWRELAKCNQEEFAKSGTEGKCIEARELIIALPESFTEYQPDRLLQLFTNHFKQNYGAECIAALHHNKRKTNYHIHLIFAERRLLDEPIIKTASRNMFYDENGKHVRTKKEILGEDGEIREGCHIVKKGEIYEKKLFTVMVFDLMRFRDDWMHEGKAKQIKKTSGLVIEPLHIVLIEEPEAHLHAQVQQVFIRKAYSVLTNHRFIKENSNFATQLVISTHSSHIARESNFADLRYFKRLAENSTNIIATSKVINLSDVFGKNDETDKFVTRYLQTTHCDLFFADAVILVEGSAENMLVPHFIRNKYPKLYQRYISILSINGRHSHRLNPLIEKLCIPTLVIADIDSAEATGHHKAIFPERGKGEISSNYTITQWLLKEKNLDNLLSLPFEKKELLRETPYKYPIRVAYQTPVIIDYGGDDKEAIASTFEDCLVYTNYKLFKELSIDDTGSLIKSVCDEINSADSFETFHKKVYETLRNGKSDQKAEFALDLIYAIDPNELTIPTYIDEGLAWLQTYLDPEE